MTQPKRLTLNGLNLPHFAFIILCLVMIGVSVYLTNHFYEAHFPKGLKAETGLCDINSFWGCDKASTSALGSLFHVPTAFFGIIVGLVGLFGAIFPSEESEKFSKFVFFANAIGCIILFIYSLVALKGLCPFCTIYYALSWLAAFLFIKYSNAQIFPEVKFVIIYAVLTILPSLYMYNYFVGANKGQQKLNTEYINLFKGLNDLGDPREESPYKIHMSTKNFNDAPIRISVFSDFECPFCQVVSNQMKPLIDAFDGKINIQYMFYPLDNACNVNVKSSFHKFACRAAYLAACDEEKFAKIHDVIFERQSELSYENLNRWEKEFNLKDCFSNKTVQDKVVATIRAAEQYNLQSTPTIIINGKKIEGTIPTVHIKAILNDIINSK
jgi:protein-disulfide isomerase/uncharacterized membrane protein